jgi:hypothetical protein
MRVVSVRYIGSLQIYAVGVVNQEMQLMVLLWQFWSLPPFCSAERYDFSTLWFGGEGLQSYVTWVFPQLVDVLSVVASSHYKQRVVFAILKSLLWRWRLQNCRHYFPLLVFRFTFQASLDDEQLKEKMTREFFDVISFFILRFVSNYPPYIPPIVFFGMNQIWGTFWCLSNKKGKSKRCLSNKKGKSLIFWDRGSISKSLPNFTWQILCFANFKKICLVKRSSSPIVWHTSFAKLRSNLHQEPWERNKIMFMPFYLLKTCTWTLG